MKRYLTLLILFGAVFSNNTFTKEQIPVQHFFCDSAMTSGTLSPNGKYFAAMVPASGGKCAIEEDDDPQAARVLLVIDLETNTPSVLSGTKGKSRLVGFQWLNNSRIAFYRQPSRGVDTYSMWAINIDGTRVRAFSDVCTHASCRNAWQISNETFICTCHNSVFNYSGQVVSGPANSPLPEYSASKNGNIIKITKG